MNTLSITDLIAEATQELKEHGLYEKGWRAVTDQGKRRAGSCNYTKRQITLSVPILSKASYTDQRETILHEIAHALMPGHAHDNAWKAKLISMGGTGKRTHNMETPKGRYEMVCAGCNAVIGHRHQKQGSWKYATATSRHYTHKYCTAKVPGSVYLRDTKDAQVDDVIESDPIANAEKAIANAQNLLACKCQCGGSTKGGSYLPGHDARHVSAIFNRWLASEFDIKGALALLPTENLRVKLVKRIDAYAAKNYK